MDDHNVEEILRRYRPAGPDRSLRARCLTFAPTAAGRTWPWLAAAAAMLAMATVLQLAGDRAVARAGSHMGPDPVEQAQAALVAALGGDDDARRLAAVLRAEDERRGENDGTTRDAQSTDNGGRR